MDTSLNLNTLASSLPSPYQNAEKDLLNNFKAAALSITTLYRSSRSASKRAYNSGYVSACNDLLLMIQQGVSAEGFEHTQSHDSSGSCSDAPSSQGKGMTIGKVMDWIEARMEAIKSREEEEDEEEERERERERASTANTAVPTAAANSSSKTLAGSKASTHIKLTREQPITNHASGLTIQSHSPSPPPIALRQSQRIQSKSSRTQPQTKGDSSVPSSPQVPSVDQSFLPNNTTFNLTSDNCAPFPSSPSPPLVSTLSPYSDHVPVVTAGAKRRHAVMMMLDSSSTSSSPASVGSSASTPSGSPSVMHGHHSVGSRRRTRSTRSSTHNLGLNINLGLAQEAMDVEEDGQGGRERKRVARR
ncbi:hypothetical protein GGU11DRAFT_281682 [Lentinula aff. detonsa]|uniref:Uncharacterized protein n=1 Tax=Lentinula aff. detonsa TaxID=2804958 RepID=A0AA38KTZ6_9AGAR|nr:hypothetical protein GGU10DRAFT_115697 [Lentinula aff. detonsa]KAJ3794715.1 hypothetical protein GGU11DRAFT_281682 [Lentinula aff. detonsa]